MTRKKLATLALALSAALGFLHGASAHKAEREVAERERDRVKRLSGASAGPGAATGPLPPKPGDLPLTPAEVQTVEGVIARAEEALKRGDLDAAGPTFAAAARAVRGRPGPDAAALARRAERAGARAVILGRLAAQVEPNEFAAGAGLTRLVLSEDRELVARVVAEDRESLTLRYGTGLEAPYPRALVQRIEPLTPEAWRDRCRLRLAEKVKKAEADARAAGAGGELAGLTALDCYRLAHHALENELRAEAVPLLERALDLDSTGLLVETFLEPRDRPTPDLVALARDGAAAPARPARPARPTAVASATPAPRPGEPAPHPLETAIDPGAGPPPVEVAAAPVDPELARLLDRFEEGRARYRQSFKEGPASKAALKEAAEIFMQVADALDKLEPGDPAALERVDAWATEVRSLLFDCRKRLQMSE